MLQGRHLVDPTVAAAATALAGQTGELPAAASWLPPAYPRHRGHVMSDPASPPIFTWTCIEGAPHYLLHAAPAAATKLNGGKGQAPENRLDSCSDPVPAGSVAQWSPTADPLARRAQRRRRPFLVLRDLALGGPPLLFLSLTMGKVSQACSIAFAEY